MKVLHECIQAEPRPVQGAFLAALPPGDVRLVRESVPTEWLPVAVMARAADALGATLNPNASVPFFCRLGVASLQSSLVVATLSSAIRLFGADPGRILRWTPQVWTQLYRDSSRVTVDEGSGRSARVAFDSLPACLAKSEAWREGVAHSFTGLLTVTGHTGNAMVEHAHAEKRLLVIKLSWRARSADAA